MTLLCHSNLNHAYLTKCVNQSKTIMVDVDSYSRISHVRISLVLSETNSYWTI